MFFIVLLGRGGTVGWSEIPGRDSVRKLLAVAAVVSLVAGGLILAVSLQQPQSALAQETEDRVFGGPLRDVLDDLVSQHVITQEQADKIASAFAERVAALHRGRVPYLETVAGVLDIDVDDLAEHLRDGKTIAEIAGNKTQAVIDALVAEQNARIDRAVENGRLTEEQADEVRTATAERIEAMVNGAYECPMGPGMLPGFGGPRGMHGPGGFFGPGEGFRGPHHWLPDYSGESGATGT